MRIGITGAVLLIDNAEEPNSSAISLYIVFIFDEPFFYLITLCYLFP
jgi:hypothetical protein